MDLDTIKHLLVMPPKQVPWVQEYLIYTPVGTHPQGTTRVELDAI
jgi:hypothetical protein